MLLVAAYLNSLGKWSLYGHTETKKVRKIWRIYEEEKMVHGKLLLGRKTILILSEHSLKRVRLHLIQANSPLLLTRGDSASGFGVLG